MLRVCKNTRRLQFSCLYMLARSIYIHPRRTWWIVEGSSGGNKPVNDQAATERRDRRRRQHKYVQHNRTQFVYIDYML